MPTRSKYFQNNKCKLIICYLNSKVTNVILFEKKNSKLVNEVKFKKKYIHQTIYTFFQGEFSVYEKIFLWSLTYLMKKTKLINQFNF